MRIALLLIVMASSALATAQPLDFVKPLSAVRRAPITTDVWGLMQGVPAFAHLQRPVAVAASGDDVYLFDAGPNHFYRFNRAQETLRELEQISGALTGVPAGITVAPDASIYVADPDGHQILHAAYDGTILRALRDDLNLARPAATVFDLEHNHLLVADMLYDHIVGFNHLGWLLFGFGQRGMERNQFQLIVDMAQGPEGLYIVDRLNPYIKIYSVDGRFLYGFPRHEVSNPAAIAVDEHQRVYVADAFDDTIKVYVKEKYVGEIGGTGAALGRFRFITDLYIDHNFLYIADSMNGRVQVFVIDPNGAPKGEEGVALPPPLPEQAPAAEGAATP